MREQPKSPRPPSLGRGRFLIKKAPGEEKFSGGFY